MPTAVPPQNITAAGGAHPSSHQEGLNNYCRSRNMRPPDFQIISDRRGGRTAWSCIVHVQGTNIQARFWYDGQYINNAREDAAERALQYFGQLPPPSGPQRTAARPPMYPVNGGGGS